MRAARYPTNTPFPTDKINILMQIKTNKNNYVIIVDLCNSQLLLIR